MLIDADRPGADDPDAPPVAVVARPLGRQTNNFAEYTAVLLALQRAQEIGAREVELVLDSKLVVEQLLGRWRVREASLVPLHRSASELLRRFERWTLRHEPRISNAAADALANLALDDPAAAARAEAQAGGQAPPKPDGRGPIGLVAVAAACTIFDRRGHVLLVRHAYGRRNWEIPGGVAQPGESPATAAERELREETNLSLQAGRLTGVYFEPRHELGPMLHIVFRFAPVGQVLPIAQAPEIEELGWFSLDDLPSPISDFTERRVRDALAEHATFDVIESRSWR